MQHTILNRYLSRLVHLVLLAGFLLTIQYAAAAGTLTVSVLRSKGNATAPLPNAQLCISGNFGTLSATTNNSGNATFTNAPQGQLTLTVSASTFIGKSVQFTMGAADQTQSLLLEPGSGGPVCNPAPPPPPVTLSTLALNPTSVNGGTGSQGTVTLSAAAPTGGAAVNLSSNNTAATVPPTINVSGGSVTATFTVSTSQVSSPTSVIITASSGGTTRTATLTVNAQPPPPLALANLRVLVVRDNNTVLPGAAVCVASGTGAVRSAFTDAAGQATFDGVAQGEVTITVSAATFTGQSHTSTLGAAGGTALFRLSAGSGGPVCNAQPPPAPPGPATLAVTSFDWHVNRRTPLFFENFLSFTATKTPGGPVIPSHYRVGENSDLSNLPWIAYQGGVIVFQLGYRGNSLTAYGQRTVHFQIKKDDITSPVAANTVDLQPVSIGQFRLESSNLSEMLTFAEDQGFTIRTRAVSATQNVCSGGLLFRRNTLDFQGTSGGLKDRDWVKVMEITLVDSSARSFTAGWRVKSIEVIQSFDYPGTQTIGGAPDGNGFKVTVSITVPRDPNADPSFCLEGINSLKAVVLEGPADDMALDQTRRWKNMFPSN